MANSIVGVFLETVSKNGSSPAVRFKDSAGKWQSRTWSEINEDRKVIAAGLMELGLKPLERVNVLANTNYEWVQADLAVQSCGAAPVAIYQSNLPHECEYIINDSGGVMVVAENQEQLNKLIEVKDKVPNVRKVIVMSDETDGSDWTMGWSDLEKLGREKQGDHDAEIEKRIAAIDPDDTLTLIYTSGTTGAPKGVVLTHSNLTYEVEAVRKIGIVSEDDVQLLFLPLAHSFAKLLECTWFGLAHEMVIDSDITRITDNMGEVKPTMMASVPRIFEKVFAKVTAGGLESPGLKGKLFKWALDLNDQYAHHMKENRPIPFGLNLQLGLARSLVFSKVGERLEGIFGGRLKFFVSGGAPLSKKIAYFFQNAGVTILEGYGLTETSAATCVNRPEMNKIGTVGKPMPGTEIKIAADGEILIKGGGVMKEYWGREEATKEVLTPDRWFATGDIGDVDKDGYVRITDRKKDIIVTAGGKNVAPQNIENLIKATSPLISQVMVYGDKRKYLVALFTLDEENAGKWAKEEGLNGESYGDITKSDKARKAIQRVLDHVNSQLASYETIKKFEILDKDFEIGEELTPTLKVKRKFASQKFLAVLETMYEEKVVD